MRYLKVIVVLLLTALSTTLIQAQAPQHTLYLPSVFVKQIWMIDPEALALQLEQTGLSQITAHYHISNEEAIAQSADPEATRAAFEAQGRVTAFFRSFGLDGNPDPLEHQVILYKSTAGASQGVQGLLAGKQPINPRIEQGVDEIYFFQDFREGKYIHSAIFRIDNYVHTMEAGFLLFTRANPSIFRQKVRFAVERQHTIAP